MDGYFKSDGTYVPPHFRSSPNSTKLDNYARDRFTMNRPSYAQMLAQGAIAFSDHDEDALDCAYTD